MEQFGLNVSKQAISSLGLFLTYMGHLKEIIPNFEYFTGNRPPEYLQNISDSVI
jgi:hypothetical protein